MEPLWVKTLRKAPQERGKAQFDRARRPRDDVVEFEKWRMRAQGTSEGRNVSGPYAKPLNRKQLHTFNGLSGQST